MTISSSYPYNLQNGTTADATQVMADFTQIQNDVNANAAHNGANSDITSMTGLTTPLGLAYGGTGSTTAAAARGVLGIGTAGVENLGTVVIDDGSGNLTLGSGVVTGAMIASSAALAGAPTTTTATQTDSSTKIATTAYVNGRVRGQQVYTSGSGTWTVPAGTTSLTQFKFTLTGGGGGGPGCSNTTQPGGGAGATGIYYATGLVAAATYAYSVGAGGAGGAAGANNGADGTQTTMAIGSIVAPGGKKGTTGSPTGTQGGVPSACTGMSVDLGGGAGGSTDAGQMGGTGGSSFWGGGGVGGNSSAGGNATSPGAGGGGAHSAGTAAGGNGASGLILIEWW